MLKIRQIFTVIALMMVVSVSSYSQTLFAIAYSTGDVSQTGTTPVSHGELVFTPNVNKTYRFKLTGGFTAVQNFGFKWNFTMPAGTSGTCRHVGSNAIGGTSNINIATGGGHNAAIAETTEQIFEGTITVGGTAGDIYFAFCQNSNSAGNPAVVKKNCQLIVYEMP